MRFSSNEVASHVKQLPFRPLLLLLLMFLRLHVSTFVCPSPTVFSLVQFVMLCCYDSFSGPPSLLCSLHTSVQDYFAQRTCLSVDISRHPELYVSNHLQSFLQSMIALQKLSNALYSRSAEISCVPSSRTPIFYIYSADSMAVSMSLIHHV